MVNVVYCNVTGLLPSFEESTDDTFENKRSRYQFKYVDDLSCCQTVSRYCLALCCPMEKHIYQYEKYYGDIL